MSNNLFRSFSPDPFRLPPGGLQTPNMASWGLGGNLTGLGSSNNSSSDPLENILGVFPCARLRGLPFKASLEDVLVFFQGLVILDVVVVDNNQNDAVIGSGEAFVVFANPLDFQMALQRDRLHMGQRYIEVFQGKRADYYAAIASKYWQNRGDTRKNGESRIKPSQDHVEPINAWSSNGPTPAQALASQKHSNHIESNNNHQHHNERGSSNTRHKGHVGGRGNQGNMGGMHPGSHRGGRGSGGGIQVGEHTGFLRMRGLPFNTTKAEISEFFKQYHPIEDSITLTYRSDGRATGEGYVGFNSPDDAQQAMLLHKSTLGSRYIELFISNKEEHSRALARSSGR